MLYFCTFFLFPSLFHSFHRTIMAALHFNFNLKRETKVDDEGQPILHVKYAKFKEGEATVREAKVSSNYGILSIS